MWLKPSFLVIRAAHEVGMLLYHGSNVCVRTPHLFVFDRRADFGPGFYLTQSQARAARWAWLVSKRRGSGSVQASASECHKQETNCLRMLQFDGATVEWLSFVAANRHGERTDKYDIVQGPVANDNTMSTLRLYFAGVYSEEEAIKRLLPQKLRDQYVLRPSGP